MTRAGRATCNVNVSSSMFADQCSGSAKYLYVEYTCEGLSPFLHTERKRAGTIGTVLVPRVAISSAKI